MENLTRPHIRFSGLLLTMVGTALLIMTEPRCPAQEPKEAPTLLPSHRFDNESALESVAMDEVGSWLATGYNDGAVRLWELKAHDPFCKNSNVFRGHSQAVRQLTISPNGRWLATSGPDRTLRLWDLSAKDSKAASILLDDSSTRVDHEENHGWTLEMSGNSRWLIAKSGTEPGKTAIWDLRAKDPKSKSVVLPSPATVRFCSSRRWLLGGGPKAEMVQVWDLDAESPWGKNMELQKPRTASLETLSPDGKWLFARHRDEIDRSKGQILVWDLKAATPAAKVLISREWTAPPRAGDISPDGRWLAIAFDAEPYGIDLWDLRQNDPVMAHSYLRGHENTVRELVFSPNNRWLVSGSDDITARIWDLQAPKPATACRVLKTNLDILVVAPNSRWLVTCDRRTVRLWDLQAADPGVTNVQLDGLSGEVRIVRITPDNRWLVTHSSDKTMRCWDLQKNPKLTQTH